eukprot:TRINITY_DN6832_c0_g1_i1.p1 TRINITY_DN6832_c0_g1~~TRINITY_DN6832_c0_g1_i1.p1  ORF type:complete len:513 (-),score=117.58 TRINITY_DN6832_c0_g1_i1:177-1553(-)
MIVCIEGCSHGELDAIYGSIKKTEIRNNIKVDLLLMCGDFQAVRNLSDLSCINIKEKFLSMNDFHKYYSGECKAPILTIFIGGNHESMSHLCELYYGGWVAPNIYYLGHSGCVNFGGLRIAGVSGIFKGYNYRKGYYETLPYNSDNLRSVYHTRELEILKLTQLTGKLDVFLSHDWPRGIIEHGDQQRLFDVKKFLAGDKDSLGSPILTNLLRKLKPNFWFSAHMHAKFPAIFPHSATEVTRFLALDKVKPGRDFLQFLNFGEATGPKVLTYDPEWLAIVASSKNILDGYTSSQKMLLPISLDRPTDEEIEEIKERARFLYTTREGDDESTKTLGLLQIPHNFVQSVRPYEKPQRPVPLKPTPATLHKNPQKEDFLNLLQRLVPERLFQNYLGYWEKEKDTPLKEEAFEIETVNDNDEVMDDETTEPAQQEQQQQEPQTQTPPSVTSTNPDEIDLGDE